MQVDKSKITQEELRRNGITELDNMTITRFKLLFDKRIGLDDFDFTTISDAEWIRDFRKALVELMDAKDAKKQDCNILRQFLEAELDEMVDDWEDHGDWECGEGTLHPCTQPSCDCPVSE